MTPYGSACLLELHSVFFQIWIRPPDLDPACPTKIDLTRRHLNEFWIGLKFWKAVHILFNLSIGFMGLFGRYLSAWGKVWGVKTEKISDPTLVNKKYFFTADLPKSMICGSDSRNFFIFFYGCGSDSRIFLFIFYAVGVDFKYNEL